MADVVIEGGKGNFVRGYKRYGAPSDNVVSISGGEGNYAEDIENGVPTSPLQEAYVAFKRLAHEKNCVASLYSHEPIHLVIHDEVPLERRKSIGEKIALILQGSANLATVYQAWMLVVNHLNAIK